jgi:hypothetical protein
MKQRIVLRCSRSCHPDIYLSDKKSVILGRSSSTKITDPRLSRKHLKLTANISLGQVECENIGNNSSRIIGRVSIFRKNYQIYRNNFFLNFFKNGLEFFEKFKKCYTITKLYYLYEYRFQNWPFFKLQWS